LPLVNEKFIDVKGIRTRYFEKGEGPPLVLFHGGEFGYKASSDCADDWDLNFDGLSDWFHVYAVDKLGQGYTDNPLIDDDYTMDAVVQHGYAFLQALGLRNVNVAGHSRGGYLVTRLALEHPDLIENCIIVASGTLAPGIGRNSVVFANPPDPVGGKECQRWVLERYSYNHGHITEDLLDSATLITSRSSYQEAVKKMDSLRSIQFNPQLGAQKAESLTWILEGYLKTPTLLIWGQNDPTATIGMGHALFDLVAGSAPRAEMHIINKAGHFCFREHPTAFNEIVRSFIQSG
jgi:pimeloyl-ACP methyl ester carboxylesterase